MYNKSKNLNQARTDAELLFSTPTIGSQFKFWSYEGVPGYPLPQNFFRAKVPFPPRLDPKDSPEKWFVKIVQAFYKIHIFHYKKNVEISRHIGYPRGCKHYKLITDFAKELIRNKLAPAKWIMFSFYVWDEHISPQMKKKKKGKSLPNVEWVFSIQRLNKNYGWCSYLSQDYIGGTIVYCPAHRELMSRLQNMRHALTRLPPDSNEHAIRETVHRYFPPGMYEKLLRDGNKHSAEIQKSLNKLAEDGDWLWKGIKWDIR